MCTPAYYLKLNTVPDVVIPPPQQFFEWLLPHVWKEECEQLLAWERASHIYQIRWLFLELPFENSSSELIAIVLLSSTKQEERLEWRSRTKKRLQKSKVLKRTIKKIKTSRINLLSNESVHSRDTGSAILQDKKILMVGQGSLGSMVTYLLAKAGVGEIILIDPETLIDANIGRHILGIDSLGESKVRGMKRRLKNDAPGVKVRGIASHLHTAINDDPELLNNIDLVIVTTADLSSERILWELKAGGSQWGLIQAWSEPYAQVGHALYAPSGAYDARYMFDHNGDFVKKFSKWKDRGFISLPACGEGFIPGGPILLNTIAGMVANIAIGKLSGEDTNEQWFTLVNDVSEILKSGGDYLGPAIPFGTCQSIICNKWWAEHELN